MLTIAKSPAGSWPGTVYRPIARPTALSASSGSTATCAVVTSSYRNVNPPAASPMKANSPGSGSTMDPLAAGRGVPPVVAGESDGPTVGIGDDPRDDTDGLDVDGA